MLWACVLFEQDNIFGGQPFITLTPGIVDKNCLHYYARTVNMEEGWVKVWGENIQPFDLVVYNSDEVFQQ